MTRLWTRLIWKLRRLRSGEKRSKRMTMTRMKSSTIIRRRCRSWKRGERKNWPDWSKMEARLRASERRFSSSNARSSTPTNTRMILTRRRRPKRRMSQPKNLLITKMILKSKTIKSRPWPMEIRNLLWAFQRFRSPARRRFRMSYHGSTIGNSPTMIPPGTKFPNKTCNS